MVDFPDFFKLGRRQVPADARLRAIDETSAFLSWALARARNLPRIPTRRMDQGGFSDVLSRPGARAMVTRYWSRALSWTES